MPREIDSILDDADDERLPQWRKVGDFEVLETSRGTAILCGVSVDAHALIRYPDKVCVEVRANLGERMHDRILAALRERPVNLKTLDLEEEASLPPPPEDPEPVAEPPKPPSPPRQWRVVPISQGDDD